MMMKTSSFLSFLCAALVCSAATNLSAQGADNLEKKEVELEKQRLELEKRTLELQRRELDLEKMRQELQAKQSEQSLSMNLSGDVLFDYDKAALKPAAEDALKKVAVVLSQFPESNVTIEGFSDAKGSKDFNLDLSRDRATTVKDWLVKNGDVDAAGITATGRGEENPIAPNKNPDGSDNPAGRALNRRVSIIVAKPPAPAP